MIASMRDRAAPEAEAYFQSRSYSESSPADGQLNMTMVFGLGNWPSANQRDKESARSAASQNRYWKPWIETMRWVGPFTISCLAAVEKSPCDASESRTPAGPWASNGRPFSSWPGAAATSATPKIRLPGAGPLKSMPKLVG